MLSQKFEYIEPSSTAEAVCLRQSAAGSCYFAGGTDVVPLMQYGVLHPAALIPVGHLRPLQRLGWEHDELVVGGAVTLHQLQVSLQRQPELLGLHNAARAVASPQIRRIGTVAGNLLQQHRCFYYNQSADWRTGIAPCYKTGGSVCHQAPASSVCKALYYSDLAPMLLSMGGTLRTSQGERPLAEACGSSLEPSEALIEAVVVPAVSDIRFTAFHKCAVRGAIDFALANAAIALRRTGRIRLFLGAMSPQPVFLTETAALLEQLVPAGIPFPPDVYALAKKEAKSLARPIREAGVSGAAKMNGVGTVLQVIGELERCLRPQIDNNK